MRRVERVSICPGGHFCLQELKVLDMELVGIVGKAPELIPIPQINSSIAFNSSFMLIVFQYVSLELL